MSSTLAVMFRQITERLESEKKKIITVTRKVSNPDFIYPVSKFQVERDIL